MGKERKEKCEGGGLPPPGKLEENGKWMGGRGDDLFHPKETRGKWKMRRGEGWWSFPLSRGRWEGWRRWENFPPSKETKGKWKEGKKKLWDLSPPPSQRKNEKGGGVGNFHVFLQVTRGIFSGARGIQTDKFGTRWIRLENLFSPDIHWLNKNYTQYAWRIFSPVHMAILTMGSMCGSVCIAAVNSHCIFIHYAGRRDRL